MYCVVKTGGKQYTVKEGDILNVEKLEGKAGDTVVISDVLFLKKDNETIIGKPRVESAKIEAKILEQGKDKKVLNFRYTRRKGFKKMIGHRQPYSKIKVEKIVS